MKKIIILLFVLSMALVLSSCKKSETSSSSSSVNSSSVASSEKYTEINKLNSVLSKEEEDSFNFFWEEQVTDPMSRSLGLIPDRYPNVALASIASVGYGLAAIPVGVEQGYITREEGLLRAKNTLIGMKNLETVHGFYYHFYSKYTGLKASGTEVSNIDTSIMIAGALVAASYFGGEVNTLFMDIYNKIEWPWFINKTTNNFYMSYNSELEQFEGQWDFYAEQLMMYFLAAGSETYPTDSKAYYSFKRAYGTYKENTFVHSWFGSIFTYQFSHAFIDFRNIEDKLGMDWYENSVIATKANYEYCVDNPDGFLGFGETGWGLTACDSPTGYNGKFGTIPNGYDNKQTRNDGTIPPCGALGSLPFAPELVIPTVNYYSTIPNLIGDYGFMDSYNIESGSIWIDSSVIGIDKGISLLMLENYRSGLIWDLYMSHSTTKRALDVLEFSKVS